MVEPENFAPGLHFFRAKPLIERSSVFRVLRQMPKGALLHGHDTAMISIDWVVQNLAYHSDLLKCTLESGQIVLTFV